MGYRVYDIETNQWIKDNVYLNPDGELFLIKQSLFGWIKEPILLDSDRYVCHKDIGLCDKENNLLYIGDYVRAQVEEEKFVIGVINRAIDPAAYAILCEDIEECFILGSEVCQFVEKIGNVFDGYEIDIEETEEDSEKDDE